MICFRRNGLRVAESYYESAEEGRVKADIHRLTTAEPVAALSSGERTSQSLVIDLRQSEEALFAGMNESTRRKVRKGLKDDLACSFDRVCAGPAIDAFCAYFDAFAPTKNLKPVFRPRLRSLAGQGMLALSRVAFPGGEVLAWHAYLVARERAVLLHSASHFRQMKDDPRSEAIQRANRILHWSDMLALRQHGVALYDFGGLDTTGRSEETRRIAEFKTGFGGTVVPVYSYTVPRSFTGAAACRVLALMGKHW